MYFKIKGLNSMKKRLLALSMLTGVLVAPAIGTEYYVSTGGSDANNGTSRETAFATIAHAVDVAEDGDTVRVLAGTYEVSAAISVTEALTIMGDTGNPADVVVRNTAGTVTKTSGSNTDTAHRVFVINNASAILATLVAEDGRAGGGGGDNKGANILIDSNGGTVTNCIIRNAILCAPGKTAAGGAGIASLSANGLITHCVITNNFATRGKTDINYWQEGGAAGVHMFAGVLRESLIAYNTTKFDNFGSAVYCKINGNQNAILVENCTIANNTVEDNDGYFYPIFFNPGSYGPNYNPLVRNTLIVGNVGPSESRKLFEDPWISSTTAAKLADAYARFVNCATDAEHPEGLTMIDPGITLTVDFRPTSGSSIIDAGATMQSPVSLDLAGNPRVSGDAVDIGCYEYTDSTGPVEPEPGPGPEPDPEPEPGDAILPGETAAATRQAIQKAIDDAVPTHGTVTLGNGLFEIDAQLNITGGVTLIDQGWAKTVIKQTATSGWDEASAKRCAVVKDGSRAEGMALTGGNAAVSGAGILVEDGVISWCCITNNTVKQYTQMGGGVCFKAGQGSIDHSIVANNTINTASSYGGGIAVTATTGPVLIDTCLVYGNSCSLNCGGGIAIKSVEYDCTVRNCTVANNRAGSNSAGIFRETGSGNLVLIDTIAVLNMNNNGEANIQTSWMPLDAANSKNCFFGEEAEAEKVTGSLFGDPKFVDAANGDYHLASDSTAKGAGASYSGIGKDLDGKDFSYSPSIGCYEVSSGKKSGVIIIVY